VALWAALPSVAMGLARSFRFPRSALLVRSGQTTPLGLLGLLTAGRNPGGTSRCVHVLRLLTSGSLGRIDERHPAGGPLLAARHAAMGLWEHSERDLHSHVRDLGFYGRSSNAILEASGQSDVYVSEGGLGPRPWWYIPESGIYHHSKLTRQGPAGPAIRRRNEAPAPARLTGPGM
jgi:hypothetical protein